MINSITVGAGASGLLIGAFLGRKGYMMLDGGAEIGRKLKVSGGGKCNITNAYLSEDNFLGDREFIKTTLLLFDNKKFLDFLNTNSMKPIINERIIKGQYFFKNSNEIIEKLKLLQKGEIKLNHKVLDVEFDGSFKVVSDRGEFRAKNLVVASGGVSYPQLGVSDIGYKIAQKFGHEIVAPRPALVGFTVQKEQFWFKNLSGVSLSANIKVGDKTLSGELLFTHKGFSGPVAMNASLYWQKGALEIDFLPSNAIDKLLKPSKKQITSVIPLPKSFVLEFLSSIGIQDKATEKLTSNEIERLKTINSYKLSPAGTFGLSRAEIVAGGVSTKEINPHSMESRLQKGLYFVGEVMDVNGELGGYNLQWCASSAFICKNSLS